MSFATPLILPGPVVSLVPLSHAHHDGLVEAVADGELWRLWYTSIPAPEAMSAEIERLLDLRNTGRMNPWTVIDADGRVLGMTTFLNVDSPNRRVEIGSTWLRASAQGTGANPAAKRLLLGHAFDTLDAIAVEFRTHWHNLQSRAAIARLGAKQDGVLRSHQVMPDGSLRDTVVFSVVAAEWPTVRRGLDERLAKADRG